MSDDPFPGSAADFYERIQVLKAEIERQEKAIKKQEECNEYLLGRVLENNQLITELADAVQAKTSCVEYNAISLIQRAREAAK
jgi:glucan phosphorylase